MDSIDCQESSTTLEPDANPEPSEPASENNPENTDGSETGKTEGGCSSFGSSDLPFWLFIVGFAGYRRREILLPQRKGSSSLQK